GCNFQLPAVGWFYILSHFHYAVIIKVQTGNRNIAFGSVGLFFNALCFAVVINFHHPKALGITHAIAKDGGSAQVLDGFFQFGTKTLPVKYIIAQNESYIIITDKLLTYRKGLGQSLWFGLYFILQLNAPIGAVAQQVLEVILIF